MTKKTRREPGIYLGTTQAEYELIDAMNHSGLMKWVDPDAKISRKSATIGHAVHSLGLQGKEQAKRTFAVSRHEFKLNTNVGKAKLKEEQAKAGLEDILRPSEWITVKTMVRAMQAPQFDGEPPIFPGTEETREVVVVSQFEKDGPLYKCRIDWLEGLLRDLKTTYWLERAQALTSMWKYRYDTQMGFYHLCLEPHYEDLSQAAEILFVSTQAPHTRWREPIVGMDLARAKRTVKDFIRLHQRYTKECSSDDGKK